MLESGETMRCPDDVELALYVEGRLPEDRAAPIEAHLAECLTCRLVAGEEKPDLGAESPRAKPTDRRVRFEKISARLELAYWGLDCGEPGEEAAYEEEPVLLMAADTQQSKITASIPSLYAEEGRLVVTFHVDPANDQVSAYFVSQDVERIQFRALQVGDKVFLSDATGRAKLEGLSPDEVIGMRGALPTALDQWELEPIPGQEVVPKPVSVATESTPPDNTRRLSASFSERPTGYELRLSIDRPPPGHLGIVMVTDRCVASFLTVSEDGSAVGQLGRSLPQAILLTLVVLV